MAKYSGKPVVANQPVDTLFERFNDLSVFQENIDALPDEQRKMVGDVAFEKDSIAIVTPQIGQLKFVVVERTAPGHIVFSAEGSPVPLNLVVELTETSPSTTEIVTVVDVEIPMMLRPLIGGKMQEAADKFGELIAKMSVKQ